MTGILIAAAYVLDLLIGDPRWFPHPVRGMGWLIARTESALRPLGGTPRSDRAAGVVLVLIVVLSVYGLSSALLAASFSLAGYFGFALSLLLAFSALATRGLADSALAVLAALETGDLASARERLSRIVGRDTSGLDEAGIARAAVETVAENASDGVVAPLFYLAIGGPALAMAYKAVNTLDSMAGYRNDRYLHFGRAAARLDDMANFIPARITGALLCSASNLHTLFIPGSRPATATFRSALAAPWRIMARDGRKHPSPNSGYPEAAMAGALGIRLGGPSTYQGAASARPFLGAGPGVPGKKNIAMSVLLLYSATLLAAAAASLAAPAIGIWTAGG